MGDYEDRQATRESANRLRYIGFANLANGLDRLSKERLMTKISDGYDPSDEERGFLNRERERKGDYGD